MVFLYKKTCKTEQQTCIIYQTSNIKRRNAKERGIFIFTFYKTLKVIKVSKLNLKRFSHKVRETKPLVVL